MPIYAEKNMRYAHFAEICKKMQQNAKNAAITYSRKNDMPIQFLITLVRKVVKSVTSVHS